MNQKSSSGEQVITASSLQPLPTTATKVFQGKIFAVYQWEQQLYDGRTAIFEKVARADAASVLPITKDKKILLSYQEQPSLQPFWGTLGGVLEPGETHQAAAIRELREESGMQSETMEFWFSVQPVTKIEWTCAYFIARHCQKVTEPALDGGEKITVHAVNFAEFLEIATREDFRDRELTLRVLRAVADPEKMLLLRRTLLGE